MKKSKLIDGIDGISQYTQTLKLQRIERQPRVTAVSESSSQQNCKLNWLIAILKRLVIRKPSGKSIEIIVEFVLI